MAVYTHISESQLTAFLSDYELAPLRQFDGINGGVQNTNYSVATSEARYILTLYEDSRNGVAPEDLPFFLELMRHLGRQDFACPTPIAQRDGALFGTLADRPAALVRFLEGRSSKTQKPEHCLSLGREMARLHVLGQDFTMHRANTHSLDNWQSLFAQCRANADSVAPNLEHEIEQELARLARVWRHDLPSGIIHADLFPDNVFFQNGALSGVIDFYFACHDAYAYDLAIALNAWCFESDASFNITKARTLIDGYQSVRPLQAAEIDALPVLAAGAAMRFLLTRLYDWLHHKKDDALVTPKNPIDYLRRLRFHKNVAHVREYGID